MSVPDTPLLVAVDIGGTFTDLAVFDVHSGELQAAKCLTTYGDFIRAIDDCLAALGVKLDQAASFKHGTTLVINALLERKGAKAALVTTRGFRDVLEIGRGNRALPFRMNYRRHDPLIPRELRLELSERMASSGSAQAVPTEADIRELAGELRRREVEAVAISFLNAYANPEHESMVAAALARELPDVFISCATELSREWYEYERTATACANAFVGPEVSRYIGRLAADLGQRGFQGERFFMGSGSGVITLQQAAAEPVRLVESGPVGGVVGAAAFARALGIPKLVAFDIGGTTAKCALVKDGEFDVKSSYWIGGYEHGFPIRSSIIDIVEVGAGGGSIARVDEHARLHVGPQSAGSVPGPVAFGNGGTQPTVTDANIVLGRLDPEQSMGEGVHLDVAAARDAMWSQLGAPLGYAGAEDVPRIALGVLSLASITMSGAIRKITIERGEDPRDFVLFAYGGGGPLHSVELARELGIPQVVVPPRAGIFSALGMLFADLENDAGRTFLRPLTDASVQEARDLAQSLGRDLKQRLAEAASGAAVTMGTHAELRYRGQIHSLRTRLQSGDDAAAVRQRFEQSYTSRYGHASHGAPVEFVSLSVTARRETAHPDLHRLGSHDAARGGVGEPAGTRKIFLTRPNEWRQVPVFRREDLPPGFRVTGPVVIEDYGSTCLADAGDVVEIGQLGEIRITLGAVERP
ncbi:hydantoinase/oxoprolinase family protein [Ramlibacter ginsenosidimutans]|uniref:Hydantoinase/oxoprolinase family protein n=1 Tax=Ramlibacter ginsenosidimutans TaxID=502333 RepID=A0A934TTA1_9BURK|nr:hydantoinase/oxoprolinase family protein [Ramlibacter ginsenosidimutans]MBK6007152.1 hydantoinase/oxoprolinase family protein [Ramlibacter ginsenosidimutans]